MTGKKRNKVAEWRSIWSAMRDLFEYLHRRGHITTACNADAAEWLRDHWLAEILDS